MFKLSRRAVSVFSRFKHTASSILVEQSSKHPGVTMVILNRHEGKNSFSKLMVEEFNDALSELKDDSSIQCLILKSSVPKVFCAGADLKERLVMPAEEVGSFVESLRSTMMKVSSLPFPTIAAIEGVALGGGLELALACDIRIAGADALLGLPECALAIIPGAGGTQRLSRLIGVSKAKELIFTGARLSAAQAFEYGVINHCVPAGTAVNKAEEMACDIAAKGPIALRMAKYAIDFGMLVDLSTSMDIEKVCYSQVIHTEDRLEGLKAFGEKRTPQYKGL